MLSAPAKSARRISSLFSIGSIKDRNRDRDRDKDNGSSSTSPANSPRLPSDQAAQRRSRSSSRPACHASSESRSVLSPGATDDLDLNAPLPPPPSLLAVNQDLADTAGNSPNSRPQSRGGSRPSSSGGLAPPGSRPGTPGAPKLSKRRSWMPGRARASSVDNRASMPSTSAWVAGLDQKVPYDLGPLLRSEPIPELWSEQGDTFVYLFPQSSNRPPSFKVDSTIFAASPSLTFLARGADPKVAALQRSTRNLSITSPTSPVSQEAWPDNDNDSSGSGRMAMVDDSSDEVQPLHLYLPVPPNSDVSDPNCKLSPEDTETLLSFRNLFAFLLGQALIATPQHPDLFSIFLDVAELLQRFEFSNLDGSNFGETATTTFANYCDELHLADIRKSREKTIEAMVLGERLRYYPLYLEGFVHGVGKFEEIKQLNSPKYELLSPITRQRLERAYLDLDNRLKILKSKLEDFDFPSLWSGIANSNTAAESKVVRFKAWKAAFLSFRRFTMQYYRQKYGSWPPKANSKKNDFEESGLNRLLLKDVYNDFADLYDMLVDRTSLTTRTVEMPAAFDPEATTDIHESIARALRAILSEYDRSTPPVLPPIPFDIPQIPSLSAIRRKPMDPKKEAKERTKKLKDSDINEILMASYTRDSLKQTPFVEHFMQFERRSAHGKSIDEIADNRCGQWLFLYAVIQSLPMLVVDVPDVRYTEGVEYFLCVAPRGGAPWIQNDPKAGRSWFGVAGGTGVVSLPSDVVTSSVEGIYRRSHCWQVAEQWVERNQLLEPPMPDDNEYDNESSFSYPPPAPQSSVGSASDNQPGTPLVGPGGAPPLPVQVQRTGTPMHSHRLSINPTLEALPLPAGVSPVEPPAKNFVRQNPNMSFDDILKEMPQRGKK